MARIVSNLGVVSRVDARELAINKRYKSNAILPQEVKDAKTNIQDDVFESIMHAREIREWIPPNPAELIVDFYFPTMQSDLDGPLKHTLDAIQDGVNKAGYEWNDRAVWHVEMTRRLGEGLILFFLRDWGGKD
jgi:hypothetical protein